MFKKPLEAIEEHFSKVTDPHKDRMKEHKLIDIIAIAICAVICVSGRLDGHRKLWQKQADLAENLSGIAAWDSFSRHLWSGVLDDRCPTVSTGLLGMGLCGE